MALQQMLKVNDRLDKITAARINFTACGMLGELCLVQAIKCALGNRDCDNENSTDEDSSSDSDETGGESSDEGVQTSISNPTSVEDPNTNEGAPPNEEDNNCGPVELGPLMIEVHLVARKG